MSSVIEPWRLEEIAAAVSGELIRGERGQVITGVTSDSRSVPPRSVFVALKGEKFDAHTFVSSVAGAGARAAIVEHALPTRVDFGLIKVENTTRAMGDLAAAYRRRFRPLVAAVTGSSGKTTTKEFLAAICRQRFRTLATAGNFNNLVGTPLTLFGMNSKTEKAVIEMGMSDRGEIARLAEIAGPSLGIITSIGPAHLERLKNIDGVIDAKSELIDHLNSVPLGMGVVVLDADQPAFAKLAARVKCRLVSVGESSDATVPIRCVRANGYDPASFVFRGVEITLRSYGRHVISNAALAAAAAESMGVDSLDIITGLSQTFPSAGRSRVHVLNGVTVIDDCYNANPISFMAALMALAGSRASRKIVVMADMLELGAESARYHAEIGEAIGRSGADILVHCGAESEHSAAACCASKAWKGMRKISCQTNAEITECLDNILRPGDCVLIKASHGMHLDQVVTHLVETLSKQDHPAAAPKIALTK